MKITIDESKWGPSLLLNPENGDMCCIGQAAEQCGAELEVLRGRAMAPAEELKLRPEMNAAASQALLREFISLVKYSDGGMSSWKLKSVLAYLNDAYHREGDNIVRSGIKAAIVEGFAEAGYKVEYV